MSMPFKVFDFAIRRPLGLSAVYCVRCEDWIPCKEWFGYTLSLQPHEKDHLYAWLLMRAVEQKLEVAPSLQ